METRNRLGSDCACKDCKAMKRRQSETLGIAVMLGGLYLGGLSTIAYLAYIYAVKIP